MDLDRTKTTSLSNVTPSNIYMYLSKSCELGKDLLTVLLKKIKVFMTVQSCIYEPLGSSVLSCDLSCTLCSTVCIISIKSHTYYFFLCGNLSSRGGTIINPFLLLSQLLILKYLPYRLGCTVGPGEEAKVKIYFTPTHSGLRKLVVDFDSNKLSHVKGYRNVIIGK